MSDALRIRSSLREYAVEFVDDFAGPLAGYVRDGAFVVCDANVHALYRDVIAPIVPERQLLLVEPTESGKTMDAAQALIGELVARQARRHHVLVALGGGVVEDVAGFTASVLYRGVSWVYFPTTLLAMADSCIGGKTSINVGRKKNLVGTFYPPSAVYVDTGFLNTLGVDDIRSGLGEILHFYVYADSPRLPELMAGYGELLPELLEDRQRLSGHIRESLAIKKRVIEVDEFDTGERQKFNYGHTFGHALESATDYAVSHGQAVTVGMDLANYLSVHGGLLDRAGFDALHGLFVANFPDFDWRRLDLARYTTALSADKKNVDDAVTCVLSGGPGRLAMKRVAMDGTLVELLARYFEAPAGAEPGPAPVLEVSDAA